MLWKVWNHLINSSKDEFWLLRVKTIYIILFSDFSLHSWIPLHILVFQSAWICVMFKSPLTFKQFIKAGQFWRELQIWLWDLLFLWETPDPDSWSSCTFTDLNSCGSLMNDKRPLYVKGFVWCSRGKKLNSNTFFPRFT